MDDSLRVNTETLRTYAPKYKTSADVFGRDGQIILDHIISLLAAMPDYDGRLQPQARADAEEINNWCKDYFLRLGKNADSLLKTAQAFEDVDNQTVITFAQNQVPIQYQNVDNGDFSLEGIDIGTSYMGYRDIKGTDSVIICMYGVCKKIVRTPENKDFIDGFEEQIRNYKAAREARDKAFTEGCAASALAIGSVLSMLIPPVTIPAAILAVVGIGRQADQFHLEIEANQDMIDATYGASIYWNKLTGDNNTGDDSQGMYPRRNDYNDIY